MFFSDFYNLFTKEESGVSFTRSLFGRFCVHFTASVVVTTLSGILLSVFLPDEARLVALFVPGGLSYAALAQLSLFALLMALFVEILYSERFFKDMLVLWRFIIMVFLSFTSIIAFAVFFRWIPLNDHGAWFSFILSFSVCFAVSTSVTIVKNRLDKRKYNKFLAEYKSRPQPGA